MRFVSLGSGSRGNATLVDAGGTRILIDCGFAARELERRLAWVGVEPQELHAMLLTHEHTDHVRGALTFARRYGLEVWATPGTWRATSGEELAGLRLFSGHESAFRLGDLRITPYPVPHDAREPCQFVIRSADACLGILTDVGTITPHVIERLGACDALILELNHDERMLQTGPYPPSLKARVGGPFGHLSNRQAAELLDAIPHGALRQLLVAHVSEKNNRPQHVRETLTGVCGDLAARAVIAGQDAASGWLEV